MRPLDPVRSNRASAHPSSPSISSAERNGFTLTELLIVIVILGVLAGIVVFAVSAFQDRGEEAACKADFKATEVAVEAFRANAAVGSAAYPTDWDDLVPQYLRQQPDGGGNYTITVYKDGKVRAEGACELGEAGTTVLDPLGS